MPTSAQIRATADRARRAIAQRNEASGWWTVTRPGTGDTDASTGDWTPPDEVVVVERLAGHFEFEGQDRGRSRDRADGTVTVETPTLCITADEPALDIGDVVAPIEAQDQSLLGRSWTITGRPASGYGVDRHYPLVEIT